MGHGFRLMLVGISVRTGGNWNSYSVDISLLGTIGENGEFNFQVGRTILGAELSLWGKLPKDGDKASGEWDTPNCHGTLSLTRKY
jgi:hypothetical protein